MVQKKQANGETKPEAYARLAKSADTDFTALFSAVNVARNLR